MVPLIARWRALSNPHKSGKFSKFPHNKLGDIINPK
jgi:hypothetical protein